MDARNIVNLICLIAGIGVIVFGILLRAGMFPQADPARGLLPIILGAIIVLWNGYSLKRHR